MRKIAGAMGLGAALTMGCLVSAGGANAEPAQPRSLYSPSALVLTVGNGDDPATAAVQRAVTLSCAPRPTGTHPDPAAACAELATVGGDFRELPGIKSAPGKFCTKEYRPITVTAQGVWKGKRVWYSHTFSNNCMKDGSSMAFEF